MLVEEKKIEEEKDKYTVNKLFKKKESVSTQLNNEEKKEIIIYEKITLYKRILKIIKNFIKKGK